MGEPKANILKIDFAWDLWKLEHRKNIREKILNSDEEDKIQIAKELGLEYPFLFKRQVNISFRNLIYYNILNDKKLYRKIIAELSRIISANAIDQEEIEDILSGEGIWSELKMPSDTYSERKTKDMSNQMKRAFLMKHLLELKRKTGELEEALLISNELSELTAKSHHEISIAPYFAERVISTNVDTYVKYDYIKKSYAVLELKNYRRYFNYDSHITPHLEDIKDILGRGLINFILNQVFNAFQVEKSPEMILYYHQFIMNLLSIGSWIYFNSLELKEKLDLLNLEFGLSEFVNFIVQNNVKIDKEDWLEIIDTLSDNKYFQEALRLMMYFQKNLFSSLNRIEKAEFYISLGRIQYFLKRYKEAIDINLKSIHLLKNQEESDIKLVQALLSIAESYSHLGILDKKTNYFEQALKKTENLNDFQKFLAYYNISLTFRESKEFFQEQEFLLLAANLESAEIPTIYLNYIDARSQDFLEYEMNVEKLIILEKKVIAQRFFVLGKNAQECFYHKDALNFFNKSLQNLNHVKDDQLEFLLWKNIGFTAFLIRDWEKMHEGFGKALLIKPEDYLSIFYQSLSSFVLEKVTLTKDMLSKACKLAKLNEEKIKWGLENITLDIFNSLGKIRFLDYIALLEDVKEDDRWNFIYHFGTILANHGFFNIAIELYTKELEFTQDIKLKAKYFNNIGSVYSDKYEFDIAIEYFNKAIELDPSGALYYANMGQTYVRMTEFAKALEKFEKVLEIAESKGESELVQTFKDKCAMIQSLYKHNLMIDKIIDEEIKTLLLTAEDLYLNFWRGQSSLDASLILLEYGKSLETMMHLNVSQEFNNLIQNYKPQFLNNTISAEVRKKFGSLFKGQSISLGTWVRIFKDLKKTISDPVLNEFKKRLDKILNQSQQNLLYRGCKFLVNERNPASHTKTQSIEYVINLRIKIIDVLNNSIEIFY